MTREREQEAAEPAPEDLRAREKQREDGKATEIGGPKGPEPTRYGDWERAGRCIDF